MNKDLKIQLDLTEKANNDLKEYYKLLKDVDTLKRSINVNQKNYNKLFERNKKLEKIAFDKRTEAQNREIAHNKTNLKDSEETLKFARKSLVIHENALDNVNKKKTAWEGIKSITSSLHNIYKKNSGFLYEQQKSVRTTELSMGVLSNQAKGFRSNIYQTSLSTAKIGLNTKELAKLQGDYSGKIGRSVQLSEEQLKNMANLAKGTMLGVEGAAMLAGNMDLFNVSAKDSAKFIEDVVNEAADLGLNANKVIDNITKNIGLLNKYTFKGGVNGMKKMAELATRFKFEMQDITNFAEGLMSPEGAVEVASKLQVLGGSWAKLGDPFELMYRSRNDITGLTKDIVEATSATAKFNTETGEIVIDPMELHRLREVANATGLSFETLANSARQAAKFTQFGSSIPSMFDEKDKEYLSNLAQFNKKSGKFEVTIQTKDGTVTESVNALRQITPALLESQRAFSQTLETSAQQALTFDESWRNIKNTIKQAFLPGFEAFSNALQNSVGEFHQWATKTGAFDKLVSFGKTIGEMGAWVVKLMTENPITTVIGLLIGKAAVWYSRGQMLGLGFKHANGSMGGPAGSSGGVGGNVFRHARRGAGMSKMGQIGMNTKLGLKSVGALGAGGIAGILSGFNEWSENSANGMGTGENLLRSGTRGLISGGGAWGGTAAGAALGTALLPGIGTIIGGIAGGMGGGALGDYLGDKAGNVYQDFVSRPGQNPVSFSSKDTLIGAKKGGPIDKMLDNSTSSNNGSDILVNFNKPLEINGRLELNSGDNRTEINLNDPILLRELSKVIQMELSKAIGGGKISSNPIAMA